MAFDYNPQIAYHGDQTISNAYGALAEGVKGFMDRRREEQAKQEQLVAENKKNDIIISHLDSQHLIAPEVMTEYLNASGTKKKAIAEGALANVMSDRIAQQTKQKEEAQKAQTIGTLAAAFANQEHGFATQKANARPAFTPEQKVVTGPNGDSTTLISVAPDRWQVMKGQPDVTPDMLNYYGKQGIVIIPRGMTGMRPAQDKTPPAPGTKPITSPDGKYIYNGKIWVKAATDYGDFGNMQLPQDNSISAVLGRFIASKLPGAQPAATPAGTPGATVETPTAPTNTFPDGTKTRKGSQWYEWRNGVPVAIDSPTP